MGTVLHMATPSSHEIVPFTVDVPQSELDDLRDRLGRTRWPAPAPGGGEERGVPLDYLRDLAEYWRDGYDWRAAEAELNAFPQYRTGIDGETVHFLHVRSPEPDALPLILIHGWPGSIAEFTDIIGPLTDPAAHGGDPRDAFHVVAPSIPGYAFSGPVSDPGWDRRRIATAFAELMARLGYDRYAAQGGDWGSHLSREIGRVDPGHVVGVHINMLYAAVDDADPTLTDAERERLAIGRLYADELSGYNKQQATRPQTLAYALTDSPVGQLAWIVEKFAEWTDGGTYPPDAVDRDQLLTDVSIYWFTATAGSSAQLYYESNHAHLSVLPYVVPTAVAVFPKDIHLPIRRFVKDNVVRWTEFDRGGHFAAMEQPQLLIEDMRSFFADLRA